MLRTGLEFAPNTKADCKKLVTGLHQPADILEAYRTARARFGTSDIVLAMSDQVGHIEYSTRASYCDHLKGLFGDRAQAFRMWSQSAQAVMQLPREEEAMWVVVGTTRSVIPSMCVIYATPYAVEDTSASASLH